MQVISTYSENKLRGQIGIRSLNAYRLDGLWTVPYEFSGDIFHDWTPGSDIHFEIEIESDKPKLVHIINWYCPFNHYRGYFESENNNGSNFVKFSGAIDGTLIRNKIEIRVIQIDDRGFTINQSDKRVMILEGSESFFPVSSRKFESHMSHGFCILEISADADPEELFSQGNCIAVFNSSSNFFDSDSGSPTTRDARYFAMYEIWRQQLEIALNNQNFKHFMILENNDDIRLGVVWSKVLRKIFPGMELTDIRDLRNRRYWEFCARLQSEFFKGY